MRVIIVGAGEVGFHIAKRLASENKDVVVIDRRIIESSTAEELIAEADSFLDLESRHETFLL